MVNTDSRVTIHMAASLDGFIARKDGSVDWMETSDEFASGETMDPGFIEAFLKTIDCYVMGSRTYETALSFDAKGVGWAYGDKPTFVLTHRELPRTRDTVEFYSCERAARLIEAPSVRSDSLTELRCCLIELRSSRSRECLQLTEFQASKSRWLRKQVETASHSLLCPFSSARTRTAANRLLPSFILSFFYQSPRAFTPIGPNPPNC